MREKEPGRGANGRFQPGHRRVTGRRKGKRNRLTLDIKQALLEAGAELGGEQGLKGLFLKAGRKDPIDARELAYRPDTTRATVKGSTRPAQPIENRFLSITVVGVPSGTHLSRDEIKAMERETLLLEHGDAVLPDNSDEDKAA